MAMGFLWQRAERDWGEEGEDGAEEKERKSLRFSFLALSLSVPLGQFRLTTGRPQRDIKSASLIYRDACRSDEANINAKL
jgi:hypothetical protein